MYEAVIGLEVHVELKTEGKLFCKCKNRFGDKINTNCCEICTGLPGAIPVFNEECLIPAVKTGLILNCKISEKTRFDRKNYFYPDLPKGYQISQLYEPFATDGHIDLPRSGKTIRIREVHMEDDAAKLMYGDGRTVVDYNRCGVPLVEIVTMPDFRTSDEVTEFMEILRKDLRAAGVTDGRLEQGSMRADINLSVRIEGESLGTRTETKNMASFKAIAKAIEEETRRQILILEKGGQVIQQTMRFDEETLKTEVMRTKENSDDYKYFPDPDLPYITVSEEFSRKIRDMIPELPSQKERRFSEEFGLRDEDAKVICRSDEVADVFEKAAKMSGLNEETVSLLLTHIASSEKLPAPEALAKTAVLMAGGKISAGMAKTLLIEVSKTGEDPDEYVEKRGFIRITDDGLIAEAVDKVLADGDNAKAISDFRSGKDKVLGFLVGKVMRELKGKGDAEKVRLILLNKLVGDIDG
ncbi:MAG: Asp-tRNA(Asn)/Glu-tRNA(Gln) amidotransferase subunit GatB [Clostridiales bacterium]|nr:Asp-tRNA(Asn)/Glu-tRNA(Gln) amidotransferase subunit GatB [Clostridiales bacterium]